MTSVELHGDSHIYVTAGCVAISLWLPSPKQNYLF